MKRSLKTIVLILITSTLSLFSTSAFAQDSGLLLTDFKINSSSNTNIIAARFKYQPRNTDGLLVSMVGSYQEISDMGMNNDLTNLRKQQHAQRVAVAKFAQAGLDASSLDLGGGWQLSAAGPYYQDTYTDIGLVWIPVGFDERDNLTDGATLLFGYKTRF